MPKRKKEVLSVKKEETPPVFRGKVVNTKALYVREGAGKDFDSIDVIYENQQITVNYKVVGLGDQEWYRVEYDDKIGYVNAAYIEVEE